MARKPVNELSAMETRDALWQIIRNFSGAFSRHDLFREARCSRGQVQEYLLGLTAAGILEKSEEDRTNFYFLVKDSGIEAPRVRRDGSLVTMGRGREQLWQTMRLLKEFTVFDLKIQASTEEHPIAESEAKSYCGMLLKADYLAKIAGKRFRMIRYTGPKPPMIQRIKSVYDPNTREVVYTEGGTDDDAA